jgi:hypothetical protein
MLLMILRAKLGIIDAGASRWSRGLGNNHVAGEDAMNRQQIIEALIRYGFSAFKAAEIAIDCERNIQYARIIFKIAMEQNQ